MADRETEPEASIDPTASEAFAAFLTRKLLGEDPSFEDLVAAHPEQEAALARLHASWVGAEARPAERPASPDPTSESFTGEIIERLAGREHGYGRYRLEGELARGGQGVIVRVWDEDLNRYLAMKVILHRGDPKQGSAPTADSRSLGRFLEEAQVTGQLDHPGIVPVHELGLDPEGRVYFTMKLVKGRDLKSIIDEVHEGSEEWTVTRALGVMLKVCEAMAYAHSKGVIHRDLKPANVMVGRYGEVFVMDWGLAHVLGKEDKRDIRIRPEMKTARLRTAQSGSADSPDSPLFTMDGDVVGTPAYMSPEQAVGDHEGMGPHSDVYSAGAMLYHLLTGRVPFVPPGSRLNNYVIWGLVQTGPPLPVHDLAPDVPAELVAICEKAMARDAGQRYRDMMELAEDLRAYIEGRVVKAHRTGAVAELRKWVARNRGLASMSAAALALLVGGLGAVGWVQARGRAAAEKQRSIAQANAKRATDNESEARRQEQIARRERANVLRLSAFQRLADLRTRADALWPLSPELTDGYRGWLEEAHELMGELDFALAQRDQLRARALPTSPEEEERAREELAIFPRIRALREKRDALLLAQDVRAGRAEPATFDLDPSRTVGDALLLTQRARPLVDPDRTVFGREAEGLAVARLAEERAESDVDRTRAGLVLSWALQANGLDEEALECAWLVKGEAPPELFAEAESSLVRLEKESVDGPADAAAEVDRLSGEIAALEGGLPERLHWSFATEEDTWWHAQLTKLVEELTAFADPGTGLIDGTSPEHGWGVARRLAAVATIEERTVTGTEAARLWREAIRSIADREECPAYGGLAIEPQLGLLPLGKDPESGLWEFVDVETGTVPERDASGHLRIPDDAGIVFVLLPGGTFVMGAQAGDPGGPNYDPFARADDGPPHEVALDPFFMAKLEMTQHQWAELNRDDPSTYSDTRDTWSGRGSSDGHPVEQVSWTECDRTLRRMGLLLPTEAQWEYAARGGTHTVWWTGADRESLAGAVNFGDAAAIRWGARWAGLDDWMDDGFALHARPVEIRPNPFGLHAIHGNVGEWCRDRWSSYSSPVAPGDGERQATSYKGRIVRGGNFAFPVEATRCASRPAWEEDFRANFIGVRPSRKLD